MEQNKDQSGAAVRGEAVDVSIGEDVIFQARSPEGDPWVTVSIDDYCKAGKNGYETRIVTASQSARAADAPSEPTNAEHHARLVLIRELGDAELVASVRNGKVSIRAALLKVLGAADALDSQPTDGGVRNG